MAGKALWQSRTVPVAVEIPDRVGRLEVFPDSPISIFSVLDRPPHFHLVRTNHGFVLPGWRT